MYKGTDSISNFILKELEFDSFNFKFSRCIVGFHLSPLLKEKERIITKINIKFMLQRILTYCYLIEQQ